MTWFRSTDLTLWKPEGEARQPMAPCSGRQLPCWAHLLQMPVLRSQATPCPRGSLPSASHRLPSEGWALAFIVVFCCYSDWRYILNSKLRNTKRILNLKHFPAKNPISNCINFVNWRWVKLTNFMHFITSFWSSPSQMQKAVIKFENWQELGFHNVSAERLIWKDLTKKYKMLLLTGDILYS